MCGDWRARGGLIGFLIVVPDRRILKAMLARLTEVLAYSAAVMSALTIRVTGSQIGCEDTIFITFEGWIYLRSLTHRMEGGMRLYDSTDYTPSYPNHLPGFNPELRRGRALTGCIWSRDGSQR